MCLHSLFIKVFLSTFIISCYPSVAFTNTISFCTTNRELSNSCKSMTSQKGDNNDGNDAIDNHYSKESNEDNALNKKYSANVDAKVKRKKKNGFKTIDNRDDLPFIVKVSSPGPHTEKDARVDKDNRNQLNKRKRKSSAKRIVHDSLDVDSVDSISSSLFKVQKDGSLLKVLGEFSLDKSTTSGDIIQVVDGTEYQVQKSRCLYKYAGGKKFSLFRKILEVKEVKRIQAEEDLTRMFKKDMFTAEDHPSELQ